MNAHPRAQREGEAAERRRPPRPRPANREARAHRLVDGRLLGYAEYGDPDGFPVFAFHGTPGCRFIFRLADALASERGLRLIAPDRPGYASSSPAPGRRLGDWPSDVGRLADALGLADFAVIGVSGGGPYAAAMAALHDGRVRAAAMVSPVGPVGVPEVVSQFSTEHRNIFVRIARSRWLTVSTFTAMRLAVIRTPGLALRGLLARASAVDRETLLRPEVSSNLIESFAEGFSGGIAGAVRDLQLFAMPWDFDLGAIAVPCYVWQGDVDRNVPPAAARYLADHIPGCGFEMLRGVGHYWVFEHFGTVLDWIGRHVPAKPLSELRA